MELIDDLLLPASLWLIMLSMGLSLTVGDFRRVFVNRRALLTGVGCILVVPPLIGSVVAILFAPSAALTVGFILLATCPGGMLSNLMTELSRGDLALSLALTIVVSIVYVLVVPFYAHYALLHFMGMAQQIEIPLWDFMSSVFTITVVPTAIGLAIRAWRPGLANATKAYIKIGAMCALLYAFVGIMLDQVEVLRENFATLFWMVLGANVAVLAAALLISRLAGLNVREASAVGIEHLIRQEGTAMFIAVSLVGNREMSLPMIMNTPVGLALCILFVILMRNFVTPRAATRQLAA